MPTVKEIARKIARKYKLPPPESYVLKTVWKLRKRRRRTRFDVQQCRSCTSWVVYRYSVPRRLRRSTGGVPRVPPRTVVATRQTQKAALAYAVKEAKKLKPASVYVCQKNGRYREERSFGGDPYPPKG